MTFESLGTGKQEWMIPFLKVGNGEGNGRKPFLKFGKGKGIKNLFPKFGNGKGMKKSIPMIRERESEAFILGNGRDREFLLTPVP